MVEWTRGVTVKRHTRAVCGHGSFRSGYGRGGRYTPEWVDLAANRWVFGQRPCQRSADRLLPEYQHVAGGDVICDGPDYAYLPGPTRRSATAFLYFFRSGSSTPGARRVGRSEAWRSAYRRIFIESRTSADSPGHWSPTATSSGDTPVSPHTRANLTSPRAIRLLATPLSPCSTPPTEWPCTAIATC